MNGINLQDFKPAFTLGVGKDKQGKREFTAYSTVEPAFCLVRKTEKAAVEAAAEVYIAYYRRFLEKEVSVVIEKVEKLPKIKRQEIKVTKRYEPAFSENDHVPQCA